MKRLRCPAWCDRREVKYGSDLHGARRIVGGVVITVTRRPGERGAMHFNGVQVRVQDVWSVQSAMELLGHPEIAQAVGELAVTR